MFNKILIANRGEIACRIIKSARRLGISSVAVYSTADSESLHVSLADEAFCVGAPAACESYLNIEKIINIAVNCGAQAIHPGYGFLSENAHFAKACTEAGLIFIGPSVQALEIMGSKQRAKQLLETTSVPLTPGYHGDDQSDTRLLCESQRLGFPVLLKAASGGGGKGMRIATNENDFAAALAGARRESMAYFSDDVMLIEKLICNPRHIEIQLMADNHGNIVHLFERDCSLQRRHQKIIEEAPAPKLSINLRNKIAKSAIQVAHAINYTGAGTVEFLVLNDDFYFMEMNTRLQVEHPVTEMITGLDLVEWQLRIAANEVLPCTQDAIRQHGHAVECRIYAEDSRHDFIPSIGALRILEEPLGTGIRIDSGVDANAFISMHYDPMISKLITWGDTRNDAIRLMQYALMHYSIGGVKTNIPFLLSILKEPGFINVEVSTDFLNQNVIEIPAPSPLLALHMAVCLDYLQIQETSDALYRDTFAWQMHLKTQWIVRYVIHDLTYQVTITPIAPDRVTIDVNDIVITYHVHQINNILYIDDDIQRQHAFIEQNTHIITVNTTWGQIDVQRIDGQPVITPIALNSQLTAPMPGTIVAILKNKGDIIQAGDALIILDAMKMEHTIHAPRDGVLKEIFYVIGAQVNDGAPLVELEVNTP